GLLAAQPIGIRQIVPPTRRPELVSQPLVALPVVLLQFGLVLSPIPSALGRHALTVRLTPTTLLLTATLAADETFRREVLSWAFGPTGGTNLGGWRRPLRQVGRAVIAPALVVLSAPPACLDLRSTALDGAGRLGPWRFGLDL